MSGPARVQSIDALRDFRASLIAYADTTRQSLAAVDVEIRRTLDWLGHDQLKYWKSEIRRREEKVGEARNALSRCLISRTASGEAPSCYDEKKLLERAKRRLEQAEQQVEKVRHWTRVVEQEVTEYQGPAQMMTNLIDGDLPQAYELLNRMTAILEEYVSMTTGDVESAPTQSLSTERLSAEELDAIEAARNQQPAEIDAEQFDSPDPVANDSSTSDSVASDSAIDDHRLG